MAKFAKKTVAGMNPWYINVLGGVRHAATEKNTLLHKEKIINK